MMAFFALHTAKAQVNEHALGVRFGSGGGISYQHGLNKKNRLEINLAGDFSSNYTWLRATGAYQWVFEVSSGLNVFVGPSASVGFLGVEEEKFTGKGQDGLTIYAGGQIGIDYNFQSIPIQISIDALPQFGLLNAIDNDISLDPALGIRWVF